MPFWNRLSLLVAAGAAAGAAAAAGEQGGGEQGQAGGGGRFGDGRNVFVGKRAARAARAGGDGRALQLHRIVDQAVVRAVDHAVVVEIAVGVPVGAGELDVVVDHAVIGAVH